MLQKLAIVHAQVKAGNNSGNLLNEIRKIIYSLYQSKEITKKVYNNVSKSLKIWKMNTIFMNSENSKTSKPNVLILNFTDKIDLAKGGKSFALSNLSV